MLPSAPVYVQSARAPTLQTSAIGEIRLLSKQSYPAPRDVNMIRSGTPPNDDMDQIKFRRQKTETLLHAYYTSVKALALSSLNRPSLPIEIIFYILRLAELVCPWPDKLLSAGVDHDRCLAGTVLEGEDIMTARPWLCTRPVPSTLLRRIWGAQPKISPAAPAMSRTYAFKPDELLVRIVPQDCSVSRYKRKPDGVEYSWKHLTSPTGTAPSVRTFDFTHEIWRFLESGDRLEISFEASNWYFPNMRSEWGVSLQVFTLWEPSEAMLNLIYSGGCRVE
ncbi:hypothetical protein FS749_001801 [Ceratobasidium sp. UAMH 11750]|nr:hypothetical protein FS749_001801 [Ceratobasidium sp. UAMH 11750]